MRARRVLVTIGLGGAIATFGCNLLLGIDQQGARPEPDETGPTPIEEAGPDTGPPGRPTFEKCSSDSDCKPPNACYTPHCDRVLGACTYALCETSGTTCSIGTCDKDSLKCASPKPYGFRTTTYPAPGATSGCGPDPDACVGAMFPFLFLGTRDSVLAFRVDDLVTKTALPVPLDGVQVKPSQIVQSGRRIWILGAPQGTVPPYRLPLAVLDVPSDPTVTALHATTAFVAYPFPSAFGAAAPNGALYVVYNDPAQGLPTALVDAPVKAEGVMGVASAADAGTYDAAPYDAGTSSPTYTMFRTANVPGGATVVASSGARLLTYRGGVVSIVERPGSATAANQVDQGIVPGFAPQLPPRFTEGPDGVVVVTAPVKADNPFPDCDCITLARMQWLLPNAIATNAEPNALVYADGYRNPPLTPGVCYSCASYFISPSFATWIDSRSVLTAAAASDGRDRTAVRLITRDPYTAPGTRRILTRAAEVPKGNLATDRVALSSSNSFGYLVLSDSQGNNTTVSVFDPRCDVPDGGE